MKLYKKRNDSKLWAFGYGVVSIAITVLVISLVLFPLSDVAIEAMIFTYCVITGVFSPMWGVMRVYWLLPYLQVQPEDNRGYL